MQSGASAEATRGAAGNGRFLLVAALVLPLLGIALLILRPELDLTWEHHPAHFWLVLGTAAVGVVLAYLTNEAASRHADALSKPQIVVVRRRIGERQQALRQDPKRGHGTGPMAGRSSRRMRSPPGSSSPVATNPMRS